MRNEDFLNDNNIDLDFIEFYVKKRYSQKLSEYYSVSKTIITAWRKTFPQNRLYEFIIREDERNIYTLFNRLYPKKEK